MAEGGIFRGNRESCFSSVNNGGVNVDIAGFVTLSNANVCHFVLRN